MLAAARKILTVLDGEVPHDQRTDVLSIVGWLKDYAAAPPVDTAMEASGSPDCNKSRASSSVTEGMRADKTLRQAQRLYRLLGEDSTTHAEAERALHIASDLIAQDRELYEAEPLAK